MINVEQKEVMPALPKGDNKKKNNFLTIEQRLQQIFCLSQPT